MKDLRGAEAAAEEAAALLRRRFVPALRAVSKRPLGAPLFCLLYFLPKSPKWRLQSRPPRSPSHFRRDASSVPLRRFPTHVVGLSVPSVRHGMSENIFLRIKRVIVVS